MLFTTSSVLNEINGWGDDNLFLFFCGMGEQQSSHITIFYIMREE